MILKKRNKVETPLFDVVDIFIAFFFNKFTNIYARGECYNTNNL